MAPTNKPLKTREAGDPSVMSIVRESVLFSCAESPYMAFGLSVLFLAIFASFVLAAGCVLVCLHMAAVKALAALW